MAGATLAHLPRRTTGAASRPPREHPDSQRRPAPAAQAHRIAAMVTELHTLVCLPTCDAEQTHLSGQQWEILAQFSDQWMRLSGQLVGQGVTDTQLDSLATPMLHKLTTRLATSASS